MASADIRMQIVTALDAAGIKASQKEVDMLVSKMQRLNKTDATKKLEEKLTKLPGKLNDVVGAMGKFGKAIGVVGVMAEAAKKGWEIGTWINENFVSPLLWAGDKAEDVARNRLAKSWNDAWASMEKANAKAMDGLAHTANMEDQEIRRVKTLTSQYLKAYSAKNHMATASMDADMQRLEIEQFEDEMALIDQGREDAIPELQAYYSLLKQQMQAKKELAAFDAKTEEDRKKAQSEYNSQLSELDSKIEQKRTLIYELDKQRNSAESAFFDGPGGVSNAKKQKWLALDASLAKRRETAARELELLEQKRLDAADGDQYDIGQFDAIRAAERATLAGKLSLDQRRLGLDYNRIVSGQGVNLLGFGFGDSMQSQLTSAATKSYSDLDEIARNTAALAEKLNALLEVKR